MWKRRKKKKMVLKVSVGKMYMVLIREEIENNSILWFMEMSPSVAQAKLVSQYSCDCD